METTISSLRHSRFAATARDAAIACAATLAMLLFHAASSFPTLADSGSDNDSLLRLVEVRDLLAGQGWFDTTQYRMGLEGGFVMHWSRLVDLPLAVLVASIGETATLILWPALLFTASLFLIMRAARMMDAEGDGAWTVLPAAVVGGLALYFVNVFPPGALDHHNIQLVLALAALVCLLRTGSTAGGSLAGACAALMLAIGMEAAPYAGIACVVTALSFLAGGEQERDRALGFGLSFAGVSAAVLVATKPAQGWLAVQCDAFSFPQVSLAILGGGGLAIAAATPRVASSMVGRMSVLVVIGVLVAALALLAFPQCLADPYAALDPHLKRYWLDLVTEAQPLTSVLRTDPALFASYYVTPALALCVFAWNVIRGRFSRRMAVAGVFLLVAVLVSLWQVRGAVFSLPIATIVLASWIGERRRNVSLKRSTRAQLVMAAAWIVSFNIVWQFAAKPLSPDASGMQAAGNDAVAASRCYKHDDYEALAALPAGTVAAVSNQGAAILRQTHHRVLSGPYHRNEAGNLAALEILMGNADAASVAVERYRIDYVALCRGNPETAAILDWSPDGLAARLVEGTPPAWLHLVPQTRGSPIEVYRVVLNQLTGEAQAILQR